MLRDRAAVRRSLFVHVSAANVPAWYRGAVAPAVDKLILIVDDEPSVREVLVTFFQQEYVARGYEVQTAANGNEALAAVRRRRPALILLDIEMPGMGGVEALRGIRAIDPTIPVIMVTGNENTRIAGEVIKDGAFSYLPKPVRLQYLDHLVAAALHPAR
jgi:DNA-binding NtrC family response regulator